MARLTACHIWKHWYSRLRACVYHVRNLTPCWEKSVSGCDTFSVLTLLRPPRRSVRVPTAGCVYHTFYIVCVYVCVSEWCHADGLPVLQQLRMLVILSADTVKQKEQNYVLGILNMQNINTLSFPSKVFIGYDTDSKTCGNTPSNKDETAHPLERPHFLASTRVNKALTPADEKAGRGYIFQLQAGSQSSFMRQSYVTTSCYFKRDTVIDWDFHLQSEMSFSNRCMYGNLYEQ